MSANGRQDLGVLQLSFLRWESEDQSGERMCPGPHSKSAQSWDWNPNDPQTAALAPPPQSTADKQLTGTNEENERAGGGGDRPGSEWNGSPASD